MQPDIERGSLPPLPKSTHQRVHHNSKMAVIRSRAAFAERCPPPAQRAIDHYFANTEAATFRGRPRTSLPSTLCSDLRRIGRTLRQPADIEALRALSREQWRQMERDTSS